MAKSSLNPLTLQAFIDNNNRNEAALAAVRKQMIRVNNEIDVLNQLLFVGAVTPKEKRPYNRKKPLASDTPTVPNLPSTITTE